MRVHSHNPEIEEHTYRFGDGYSIEVEHDQSTGMVRVYDGNESVTIPTQRKSEYATFFRWLADLLETGRANEA